MGRTIVFSEQEFDYVRRLLRANAPVRDQYLPEELTVYSVFEIPLEVVVPVTPQTIDVVEPTVLDEGNLEVVDVEPRAT